MLYIKKQLNDINLQKDTEHLNDSYSCLFKSISQ